jgi:hypothetical protein
MKLSCVASIPVACIPTRVKSCWRLKCLQETEASLQATLGNAVSTIALNLLTNYLAGARIALLQWWLEKRRPHTAEEVAQAFHRLKRALIRDAYGIGNDE